MGLIVQPTRRLIKPRFGAESQLDRSHPLAQGLVGAWLMNEGAGNSLWDSSRRQPIASGTDLSWVATKAGGALALNGTSSTVMLNSAGVYTNAEAEANGWTWYAIVRVGGDWSELGNIAGARHSATNGNMPGGGVVARGYADEFRFGAMVYDGSYRIVYNNLPGETTYAVYHVVGVLTANGILDCFVNGQGSDSPYSTVNMSNLYGTTNAEISSIYSYWEGAIIALFCWNRGLSPFEITNLYRDPYQMFRRGLPVFLPEEEEEELNALFEATVLGLEAALGSPSLLYDYVQATLAFATQLAIQNPVITVGASAEFAATALALEIALHDPSLTYDMTVTPNGLVSSLALHSPTVNFDMTVLPNGQAMTLTFQVPTETYDYVTTPVTLGIEASLGTPTTAFDYTQIVSALALTLTRHDPTVSTVFTTTVEAGVLTVTATLHSPSVAYDMTVLASVMAAELQQPSVTISYDCLVAIQTALSLLMTLNAPTITSGVTVTIEPSAQGIQISLNSPDVAYDFTQVVAALGTLASLQGVDVSYDFGFDVSALSLQLALHAPVIFTGMLAYASLFLRLKKVR